MRRAVPESVTSETVTVPASAASASCRNTAPRVLAVVVCWAEADEVRRKEPISKRRRRRRPTRMGPPGSTDQSSATRSVEAVNCRWVEDGVREPTTMHVRRIALESPKYRTGNYPREVLLSTSKYRAMMAEVVVAPDDVLGLGAGTEPNAASKADSWRYPRRMPQEFLLPLERPTVKEDRASGGAAVGERLRDNEVGTEPSPKHHHLALLIRAWRYGLDFGFSARPIFQVIIHDEIYSCH